MTQHLWRLMVFDVPDRLGGLLARLGFRQTRKNPKNWWRTFDPEKPGAREHAKSAITQLRQAGLEVGRRNWSEVEAQPSRGEEVARKALAKSKRVRAEELRSSFPRRNTRNPDPPPMTLADEQRSRSIARRLMDQFGA